MASVVRPKKKEKGDKKQNKRKAVSAKRSSLPAKLTPPRLTENVYLRKRLFSVLDNALKKPVIWISAPAGAGKTSLVASYLQDRKLKTLWYQIDAGDGDIASFFYYLGLAAPLHKQPLPLLTSEYLGDVPTFTRNFFRELFRRVKHGTVLVFDNYHEAPEDSRLHDVLHTAMSEVPQGITLLVLSRVDPPSVLARLRLCDYAACIDWPKLQLTAEESAGIGALRLGEHTLSNETLHGLHERAHGWAAGLVLMLEQSRAGDLTAAPATTDRKLIFDYFAGELLARSSAEERDFLLKTSLLPKFTVAMAQSLTGNARASAILDDLTRRNYFTVRIAGTNEDSFEYHPLFREFLRARVAEGMTPADYRDLQLQAARLLEANGYIENAVALLQDAQDWHGKGALIAKHALAIFRGGRGSTLDQWISDLPAAVIEASPWLRYWWGIARLPIDPRGARVLLEHAYEQFKMNADVVGQLYGFAAMVDSYAIEWGDFTPLDRWIAELDVIMRAHPLFPSPEIEALVSTRMFLALMYRQPHHSDIGVWEARAWNFVTSDGDPEQRVFVSVHLLIYYTWWIGLLPRANQLLKILRSVAERREVSPLTRISYHVIAAGYCWMVAENERGMITAKAGFEIATESGMHLWDVILATQVAFSALSMGDVATARDYLDRMLPQLDMNRYMDASLYYYVLGWPAWLEDDIVKAREHHELAVDRALKSGIPFFVGCTRIELALTMHRLGNPDAANLLWQQARDCARTMRSYTLEYICALKNAEFALDRGDDAACVANFATMLRIAQERNILNHSHWRAPLMARLYSKALEHGVETEFVCRMIRLRKLSPPPGETTPDLWPFPLKLYTFGRFGLLIDDKPIQFSNRGQKKPMELLKALIALGGRDVPQAEIIDLLWPDTEGDASYRSLITCLQRLRNIIGYKDAVIHTESRLSLDTRYIWADNWAFERLINHAEDAEKEGNNDKACEIRIKAISYYNGSFLGKDAEQGWALSMREHLRVKFIRQVELIGTYWEGAGNWDKALECYQKALGIDNISEVFYQRLMRIYQHLGRNSDAILAYQRCCKELSSRMGVPPSPATEEIYNSIQKR